MIPSETIEHETKERHFYTLHKPNSRRSFSKCTTRYYLHFKMAAANSTPSLKHEVCTATGTLCSKFCVTCGAKRDEETQAIKYYFNKEYVYEVILCFFLKNYEKEISLWTLKEIRRALGLRWRKLLDSNNQDVRARIQEELDETLW